GATLLERACIGDSNEPMYVAALGDARLLQQREEGALVQYEQAFPALDARIRATDEPPSPWKQAHPDWLTRGAQVTLPGPGERHPLPSPWVPRSLSDTRSSHLLNWALLLVRRRRVAAARILLE